MMSDLILWIHEVAIKFDENKCLIWPFGSDGSGRGRIRLNGKPDRAHRYICFLVNGLSSTEKPHALHSCGNGHIGCVNPNHIYWGSAKDNAADRSSHGRLSGEKNGRCKLKDSDVLEIRKQQGKISQRVLAERFGVSQPLISLILKGTVRPILEKG